MSEAAERVARLDELLASDNDAPPSNSTTVSSETLRDRAQQRPASTTDAPPTRTADGVPSANRDGTASAYSKLSRARYTLHHLRTGKEVGKIEKQRQNMSPAGIAADKVLDFRWRVKTECRQRHHANHNKTVYIHDGGERVEVQLSDVVERSKLTLVGGKICVGNPLAFCYQRDAQDADVQMREQYATASEFGEHVFAAVKGKSGRGKLLKVCSRQNVEDAWEVGTSHCNASLSKYIAMHDF